MNAAQKIVFDNLVRPSDVVGEVKQITAVTPPSQAFVNSNAAGKTRQVESLDEIRECAKKSGERLKELLK